jgi:Flp pilus assembly CpaE family ATPase
MRRTGGFDRPAVLVAPASADQACAVLRDLAEPLSTWAVAQGELDVIVDCGRLTPAPLTLSLLQRADRVLLVTRPWVDQLRPAARRIDALATVGVDANLLLVGDDPYGPEEVASSLGVSVAGTVAWDPATAGALTGASVGGDLRRSALVRSAASLADLLTGQKPRPLEPSRKLSATVDEGVGS